MTASCSRGVVALSLVISLFACRKEAADPAHPSESAAVALSMPPVMAHVPADTPYLVAGLAPMPPALLAHVKQSFGPLWDTLSPRWQRERQKDKLFDAILGELDGKWTEAGFESLGFSAEPRFAIYGLGLQPVVARVAIKDGKAVQATIERIAARAGKTLPAMASKDGRSYWKQANGDGTSIVIALVDNQAVLAIGKAADIDAKLGLILGSEKPAQSMADGALVKQLMARHHLGAQVIAFADSRRIAGKVLELAAGPPSPACSSELDRVTATVPRIVFGYGELSAARLSGGMVVELSPDAVAQLRAATVEIPGLTAALSGSSMFAFGGGVDLARAQQISIAVADRFKQLGAACSLAKLADKADKAARKLSGPLPPPIGQISGGAMVVDDVVLSSSGGMPQKLEGLALLASPDARGLFSKLLEAEPTVAMLGIIADGKLHDIALPVKLPFTVAAGVGERTVVVTAGSQDRAAGEKLLAAHGDGRAPLLAVRYDLAKFMPLIQQGAGLGSSVSPDDIAIYNKMASLFGTVSGSVEVTDQGLAVWGTTELK